MNPFHVLETVQEDYRKYVESFQLIKSADIPPLLADAIDQGELLWKDPYVQISRRFQPGGPLTDLIQDGTLHADCARVFYRDENDPHSPPVALHSHQRRSVEAAQFVQVRQTRAAPFPVGCHHPVRGLDQRSGVGHIDPALAHLSGDFGLAVAQRESALHEQRQFERPQAFALLVLDHLVVAVGGRVHEGRDLGLAGQRRCAQTAGV